MISLRAHNLADYLIGAALLLCPYFFGFSDLAAARAVFLVLGFGLIGYSMLTRYEYSVIRWIPLGAHLFLDVMCGIALMVAPSIFGYRALVTGPQLGLHFILGLALIGLVSLTQGRNRIEQLDEDAEEETERPRKAA